MLPESELTCRELVELVTEYLEGALDAPERERFETHLATCPYCRTYLDQMRHMVTSLSRLSEETLDPVARDELLRAFRGWKAGR